MKLKFWFLFVMVVLVISIVVFTQNRPYYTAEEVQVRTWAQLGFKNAKLEFSESNAEYLGEHKWRVTLFYPGSDTMKYTVVYYERLNQMVIEERPRFSQPLSSPSGKSLLEVIRGFR